MLPGRVLLESVYSDRVTPSFTGRIREAFGAFPYFGERLPVPRVFETFAASVVNCAGVSAAVLRLRASGGHSAAAG